jgi:endo-1,4-beta-D-glucanase Y
MPINKPFPQHTSYAAGIIKPNHVSQSQLDQNVARLYDEWKVRYVVQNKYKKSQFYIYYNRNGESDSSTPDAVTVSEAHGFGMLTLVLMAGYDVSAQKIFDGMYRFYKAHPSINDPALMAWQQVDRGGKIINNPDGGNDSATDGDLDIAYALYYAYLQWGNSTINYLSESKKVMSAIMRKDIHQKTFFLKLGDWASDSDKKYGKGSRPSDYMLHHLKVFKTATGDATWNKVIDKTYSVIQNIFSNYSASTGLLPDFVVIDNSSSKPAPSKYLEGKNDDDYSWNSCRTPWRIATDLILTGDARAKSQLTQLNRWIRTTTNNNPSKIVAGYQLNGKPLEKYDSLAFAAPFTVSAMIDANNQDWLNKCWTYSISQPTNSNAYYDNCIRMLSMIIVSGNWW